MSAETIEEDILAHCVAGRTLQIARIIGAHYDKALAETGVTPQQLTLLSMICKMGSPSASAMLPFLKMDQSTLSRNLERMVAKGWLEASPSEQDARVRCYSTTSQGEAAMVEAHAAWQHAQSWAEEALGTSGINGLKSIAHHLNPLLPYDMND
ncbi:MarR family winged helix-turn-helix transcriptional regulator [Altererythrobacter lutimaris]|uniref:Winged helix-turn-helix transcriptional regulator n=1 Tax=Altererythrobacter lutimaris TaxID=2743979 RepID=A0A850H6Z6_9SPHN|nr:MarR family winged helix-turn-helix transcriptional regulator [Altererythrobacter lutimaris]NVE93529.1 winged helix-turn-helix transcriptional regulator [Altererythrobacter lutimaris]